MKNPFPYPSPIEAMLLSEVCTLATTCYERGWNVGTAGNFSIRSSNSSYCWVSRSGVPKGYLTTRDFLPLYIEDGNYIFPVSGKVSDEAQLHLAIYKHQLCARCVAHVHPEHLVKYSCLHEQLSFRSRDLQKALGLKGHQETLEITTFDNSQDMISLDNDFQKFFNPNAPNLLMLRGHSLYAWGDTPQMALNLIEVAEFLAKCQLL